MRGEDLLDDSTWIRKARNGDAEAFRLLVERYTPVLWSVINRMTNNTSQAEDLFQESVIRFWKGLPSFKGDSKISTWLYRITYRVCLDALEASDRKGVWVDFERHSEIEEEWLEDVEHSGAHIESDIAARDAVERGLEKLHPQWRVLVILHYWRGLSMEEIADVTGRPVNTVKVYLHRARALLRKVLEAGGYPPGS